MVSPTKIKQTLTTNYVKIAQTNKQKGKTVIMLMCHQQLIESMSCSHYTSLKGIINIITQYSLYIVFSIPQNSAVHSSTRKKSKTNREKYI